MTWLRKPVPFWSLLVGILLVASLMAAVLIVPGLLAPRPDFVLVPKDNNLIIYAFNCGEIYFPCRSNGTTLTIKPLADFTGIVTFTTESSNTGIAVTMGNDAGPLVTPFSVSLGPAIDLKLSATSWTIGNYTTTVTATSGAISHSLVVPVLVQNMTAALSATSLTIARGSTANVQMNITSVNRASPGNVTLTGNVYRGAPGVDPYSNVTFIPSSFVLLPGATIKTILTVSVGQSASTGSRVVNVYVDGRGVYGFYFTIPLTIT